MSTELTFVQDIGRAVRSLVKRLPFGQAQSCGWCYMVIKQKDLNHLLVHRRKNGEKYYSIGHKMHKDWAEIFMECLTYGIIIEGKPDLKKNEFNEIVAVDSGGLSGDFANAEYILRWRRP